MKESLKEALTRKHFQMVADTIKAVEDPKKRAELAQHHAQIFAKSNPRFDHKRFMAAANVQESAELDEALSTYSVWHDGKKVHDSKHAVDAVQVATQIYAKTGVKPQVMRKGAYTGTGVNVEYDVKVKRPKSTNEAVEVDESLAYEGEGTYTVHHGKTGEKVHTGMSKHGAMEAAIRLHAKTGIKPKVYHRAISGYGGRSYGKIKQEIPIEGVVNMADKPNLTESERIAYKAAFKEALQEAKKHAIGSTVLVGTKKGYVVSTGGDSVDVMDHESGKVEAHHHTKVVKYSKAAAKRAREDAHVRNATNPNSETYMSSSYEPDFDYDFFTEGKVLAVSTHEPTKQNNIRNAVAYLRLKHAYYQKKKDGHNASMTKRDLDSWETMLNSHIKKFGELKTEAYEPKVPTQGSFSAPNSEYDTNPGYNVLGTEKIHGKIVKYVRMGSFFAPVMVIVDGEPFETVDGEVVKFAGQNAARDEMWAKLNPALQGAFDAAQSGKGGQNHNEVEDSEDVIKPEAPVQESTNPDEWDDSLVEEIIIESSMFAKSRSEYLKRVASQLSPEENAHIDKNRIPHTTKHRNASYMKLPYKTPEHRAMADSIAKKLGLKKKFRGPREKNAAGVSKGDTKKSMAHSVALY